MEEQLRYYFYDGNVETATTEIRGWQELTSEEIEQYMTGLYDISINIDGIYSFILRVDQKIDLEEYKLNRIKDLSALSLSVGEIIAPTYMFNNCLLSKDMEELGEIPIYKNWRDVLNEYKNKRIALRNEFYRLKTVVENANSQEEIDKLFTIDIFKL